MLMARGPGDGKATRPDSRCRMSGSACSTSRNPSTSGEAPAPMTATMTDAVDISRWTRWSVKSCARASWAGPPGRVSITMRKGSRITEPPSVVTPLRRWAAALSDSQIAFDPPVTNCWRAMSRNAMSSALAGSSGSADASLVEVPPNPFAQLFGNEP